MVEKIKELKSDVAVIKCKDYEIKEGSKDSEILVLEFENKLKVAIDIEEYFYLLKSLEELMKEVFELKLEKAILSALPIDYEDVKAVVLEEMKKHPNMDIEDAVKKVKTEHPNLFYDVNLDKIL